jgi:hypothetical protein
MTPRAFALETRPLLNPLSCLATAAASAGSTPCWSARSSTWDGVTHSGVGWSAAGETARGRTEAAPDASGAPLGSLSRVDEERAHRV